MKKKLAILLSFTVFQMFSQHAFEDSLAHSLKINFGYAQLQVDGDMYDGLNLSASYERYLKNYLTAEIAMNFGSGNDNFNGNGNSLSQNPFQAITFSSGLSGKLNVFKNHTLSIGPLVGLAILGVGSTVLSEAGTSSTSISYNLNFVYGFNGYYALPIGKTTALGLLYCWQSESRSILNWNIQRVGLVFIKKF